MALRILRLVLIPLAVLVAAAALGTFVIGRNHVSAGSASMENPGIRLTSSDSSTPSQRLDLGRTLFEESCSSCHGDLARGSANGPNLQGVGSAAVDLWLSTGWMPLKTPTLQPANKPPSFSPSQITAIAEWVASLKPGGFAIPGKVNLAGASEATGFDLFSLNCAPCHTITGAGDALANGYHAPPLRGLTQTQVLEAIRTGPQNMPIFSPGIMPNSQALDVVDFVTKQVEHPDDIGGIGLGQVGPVAEGFVGLFVGVGACLLAAFWVGDRTVEDDEEDDVHHAAEGEDGDTGEGDTAETTAPGGA